MRKLSPLIQLGKSFSTSGQGPLKLNVHIKGTKLHLQIMTLPKVSGLTNNCKCARVCAELVCRMREGSMRISLALTVLRLGRQELEQSSS